MLGARAKTRGFWTVLSDIRTSVAPIHTTDRLCLLTDINNTLLNNTLIHTYKHTHSHTHWRRWKQRRRRRRQRRGTTTGGTLVQSKHFENGIVDDTVDGRRRRAAETRTAEAVVWRWWRWGEWGYVRRGPGVQLVCTAAATVAAAATAVEGLFI